MQEKSNCSAINQASSSKKYSEYFDVKTYETGINGCAKILNICNYLEEVAGKHANVLGIGMNQIKKDNLSWVLAKMRFEFIDYPNVNDKIKVSTWPVYKKGLTFKRDFTIEKDSSIIVKASYYFVIINILTRKLERITDSFFDPSLYLNENAILEADAPINTVDKPDYTTEFKVRLSDIDNNKHVNNVRYIDFALESAFHLFASTELILKDLSVAFKAESFFGDEIISKVQMESKNILIHGLFRKSDNKELARLKTVWGN